MATNSESQSRNVPLTDKERGEFQSLLYDAVEATPWQPEFKRVVLMGVDRVIEACAVSEKQATDWQPMIALPGVVLRTEMLFKTERQGRDGLTHTHHEVLLVWPDGVLTDFSETVVAPEEMPTHWMRLPK